MISKFSLGAGLLTLAAAAAGAQTAGQITYVEGTISIVRDGSSIDPSTIAVGSTVEDLDTIQTGADGTLTLATDPSTGVDENITVQPNTSFTLNLEQVSNPNNPSVELLAGTLSLAVNNVANSSTMDVNTESAVMGVRGTVFEVSTIASGDALLSVSDGQVSCTATDGTQLSAVPGNAVQLSGTEWTNKPYDATGVSAFRDTWRTNHLATLRAHASTILAAQAASFDALRRQFESSYGAVMARQDIVNKWIGETSAKKHYEATEFSKERAAIIDKLETAHRDQIRLEHVYYRLFRLEDLQSQGYAFGDVSPGVSAADFFAQLHRERATIDAQMARLRWIVKIDRTRMHETYRQPAPVYQPHPVRTQEERLHN